MTLKDLKKRLKNLTNGELSHDYMAVNIEKDAAGRTTGSGPDGS